jgi:hypothetical protein
VKRGPSILPPIEDAGGNILGPLFTVHSRLRHPCARSVRQGALVGAPFHIPTHRTFAAPRPGGVAVHQRLCVRHATAVPTRIQPQTAADICGPHGTPHRRTQICRHNSKCQVVARMPAPPHWGRACLAACCCSLLLPPTIVSRPTIGRPRGALVSHPSPLSGSALPPVGSVSEEVERPGVYAVAPRFAVHIRMAIPESSSTCCCGMTCHPART